MAALMEKLLDLAFNAEREETQLNATSAALDREKGKPVAHQEVSLTLSHEDALAQLEDEPDGEGEGAPD